ncbi:MAG: hypothetical protein ACXW3T_14755 [Rhodoplanes sp.]
MSLKDALHLWPSARPIKRKLDDAAIARLAKGFGLKKGVEPKNSGVEQSVGPKMIRAAADDAEERVKSKEAG